MKRLKAQDLPEVLPELCEKIGMNKVQILSKNPNRETPDNVFINITDKNRLSIFGGNNSSDFNIYPNFKKRQFLLKVYEPARTVQFKYPVKSLIGYPYPDTILNLSYNDVVEKIETDLEEKIAVIQECKETYAKYPNHNPHPSISEDLLCYADDLQGPSLDYSAITRLAIDKENMPDRASEFTKDFLKVSFTITAEVDATCMYLLIGFDEPTSTAPFISAVSMDPKQKITSVSQAHDLLRPDTIPKDYKKQGYSRQGEWFFTPLDKLEETDQKQMKEMLEIRTIIHLTEWPHAEVDYLPRDYIIKNYHRNFYKILNGSNFFIDCDIHGSSHLASLLVSVWDKSSKERVFVKGLIQDERGKKRHSPLLLTDWHEVTVNNEINLDGEGWD